MISAIHTTGKKPITLVVVSLVLLVITTISVPTIDSSTDIFLYAKTLPITYWVGLVFSLLLLLKWRSSRMAVVCSTVLITLYVFALPSVVYINDPGSRDVYGHLSRALYIMRTNHVQGSPDERFPGAYFFMAILLKTTGIDPLYVAKAYHPVFILLVALSGYLIAKKCFGSASAYIAPLAVFGLSWFGSHFGKSTYSVVLYVILVFVLLMWIKSPNPTTTIPAILIYGALTISHPLSSILVPFMILLHFLVTKKFPESEKINLRRWILLLPMIWCTWYIVTGFFTKSIVESLKETYLLLINELSEPTYSPIKYLGVYSAEYSNVIILRVFSSLFAIVTGTILSAIAIAKRRSSSTLLLASGFLVCLGLFVSSWSRLSLANLSRAVVHALIFQATLLSGMIGFGSVPRRGITKFSKIGIQGMLVILVFLVPISSFTSSMPSMHIPTISMKTASFLVQHYVPKSSSNLSSEYIAMPYIAIKDSSSPLSWDSPLLSKSRKASNLLEFYYDTTMYTKVEDYDVIVISHGYFVLDCFSDYNPPFNEFLSLLTESVDSNKEFNKVYTNSRYCTVYSRT